MAKSFTRTLVHSDDSTEVFAPHVYGCGHYKVFKRYPDDSAEKASGAEHITWDKIEDRLRKGHSLWMRGERHGPPVLISPKKIKVL